MKYLLYITILASTLLLYSCGPNIVYEESHTLNETWGYGDAIEFSFDIDDASTVYDILLTVNHSSDFSYQNFYTQITTTYPTAEEFTRRWVLGYQRVAEKNVSYIYYSRMM